MHVEHAVVHRLPHILRAKCEAALARLVQDPRYEFCFVAGVGLTQLLLERHVLEGDGAERLKLRRSRAG